MFLSIDGVDGVGKSTQIDLLCDWLTAQGHEVVTCRDPGTTAVGEALRQILLGRHEMAIHRRSEMLIYMAARAQLVEEVIRPALAAGKTVVSDRFLLANVVYQGHAGGLGAETVWQVGEVAIGGVSPDLVVLLDLDVAQATARRSGPADRMEAQGHAFLERVRQGFLDEARQQARHIAVIDASAGIASVHAEVCAAVRRLLPTMGEPQGD